MTVHSFALKFKVYATEGSDVGGDVARIKLAVLEFMKEINNMCYDIELKETSK
jgi:hypothetical protein